MAPYIARRLISAVPVVFAVTLIVFIVMHLVPGDPALALAGTDASQAEIDQLRHQLGIDRPLVVQLTTWYAHLVQGNLGRSFLLGQSVTQSLLTRAPVTLSLAVASMVLTLVTGIPLGILAAVRQNSWIDEIVMTTALLGVSVPNFWLALMFIYLFAVALGWLPVGGYVPFDTNPIQWLRSITLPTLSLSLMQVGLLARMTRSSMLEVLREDYMRSARSKGLSQRVTVWRHGLANAMIPISTVIGLMFGPLLGGAVVIETVYSMPGIGRLIVNGILHRDYPVIQGGLLVTSVVFVALNILVDVCYVCLDPRVRYQ
jgi:peptide/nickel transport system permease protein